MTNQSKHSLICSMRSSNSELSSIFAFINSYPWPSNIISNHQMRFDQQVENARNYVLPFVEKTLKVSAGMTVLEIGCGERWGIEAVL